MIFPVKPMVAGQGPEKVAGEARRIAPATRGSVTPCPNEAMPGRTRKQIARMVVMRFVISLFIVHLIHVQPIHFATFTPGSFGACPQRRETDKQVLRCYLRMQPSGFEQ